MRSVTRLLCVVLAGATLCLLTNLSAADDQKGNRSGKPHADRSELDALLQSGAVIKLKTESGEPCSPEVYVEGTGVGLIWRQNVRDVRFVLPSGYVAFSVGRRIVHGEGDYETSAVFAHPDDKYDATIRLTAAARGRWSWASIQVCDPLGIKVDEYKKLCDQDRKASNDRQDK